MRVLVIEDEEDAAISIRASLLDGGHAPRLVPSVAAALDWLATEHPDAIFLNLYYYFPGTGGLEFLRRERVRASGIPIIAISGFATESQARQCLRLGAVDFVQKPVPPELLREIMAYLEVRAGDQRLDGEGQRVDRRRSPRPRIVLPIRVVEGGGAEWQTKSADLSAFGIRVRPAGSVTLEPLVKVSFALPYVGERVSLLSTLVREDPQGRTFRFVNLSEKDFRGLRHLVRILSSGTL